MVEIGRRLGTRRLRRNPESANEGIGAVEGALFGLLGLLLAFTFGGAAARFDNRRTLITNEANAIGTALKRLDRLPESHRAELRGLFKEYIETCVGFHRSQLPVFALREVFSRSNEIEDRIWERAIEGCKKTSDRTTDLLVLPALNEMFDNATIRRMSIVTHPPLVIFGLLFVLSLGCGLLVGNSIAETKGRDWIHGLAFAVLVSLSVCVILDLEFPRRGSIRIDEADVVLTELLASIR